MPLTEEHRSWLSGLQSKAGVADTLSSIGTGIETAAADISKTGLDAGKAAIAAGSPGSAPAAPSPAIAKARQAWVATRQKVDTDIGKLHDALSTAFKGHGKHGDLTKAFRDRVDGVLGTLDESLAGKLDAVNSATDQGERAKLVQEAQALIDGYSKHVASDATIAELDKNPFMPLSIQKTVTATLAVLAKTIR